MMRRIVPLVSVVIVISIMGLTNSMSFDKANADNVDCLTRMSDETAKYVKEMRIPLKPGDSEFYANKTEQVYLLNSAETPSLDFKKTIKDTVAVINYKDASGKGSFFVIEQEITADKITLLLKKDSRVLQSRSMKLFLPGGSTSRAQIKPGECDCTDLDAFAQTRSAELLADANRTCTNQVECLPACSCINGHQSVAFNYTVFQPTSWRCRRLNYHSASLWILIRGLEGNDGNLLDHAFAWQSQKKLCMLFERGLSARIRKIHLIEGS